MNFDQEQRGLLADLADMLIPAAAGMLSASQADVSGGGLDLVLAARPDLAEGLRDLLSKSRGRQPSQLLARLRDEDPVAMGVLGEIVAGAYFMNPDVRRSLGYDGQSPRPIDPRPDYMEDGLLESVIRRGPIYRPTPPES